SGIGNLAFTLTSADFTITTPTGGSNYTSFVRGDGAGTSDPAQLLLIDNLDTDRAQPIGLKIQSAAGKITTDLDVSDGEIDTGLALGSTDVTVGGVTISSTEFALLDGRSGTLLDTANYATTLDSIYVNVGESPAAGDITGSFTAGLTIGANTVAL